MIRRLTVTSLLLAVAGPSWAANKDIERLQFLINGLQSQMSHLSRQAEENVKETKRLNELLAEQNALLRKSTQDRKVQDEALQTTLKELSERLAEMGERFQALQQGSAAPLLSPPPGTPAGEGPGLAGAAPPAGSPAPPPPRELYSQAYADYARGNYDLSIQGFSEYIKNYPNTDFTDNAQYWIGECHYGKQRYDQAIEAWNALLRDYPSSEKLPDARVKKGMALEKLGRRSQALIEYRYVADRYPNSQAARIARDKLNPQ